MRLGRLNVPHKLVSELRSKGPTSSEYWDCARVEDAEVEVSEFHEQKEVMNHF